ncbi:MAG: PIG-L family deacetylase, partial [Candidatus Dormiibacterota bacterium]
MATDELTHFERALVIVAHPDDAEFGAAGTVARWVEHGVEVNYVICTDGSSGLADPSIKLADLVAIREAEQREAAEVLGVKQIEFLRQPDGQLRPTDELRRQIVALIRKYRPDRIICQNAVRNYSNLY